MSKQHNISKKAQDVAQTINEAHMEASTNIVNTNTQNLTFTALSVYSLYTRLTRNDENLRGEVYNELSSATKRLISSEGNVWVSWFDRESSELMGETLNHFKPSGDQI